MKKICILMFVLNILIGFISCDLLGLGDDGDSHTHQFSSAYKSDDYNHWNECSCGEKTSVTSHTWLVVEERCSECNRPRAVKSITVTTLPTTTTYIVDTAFDSTGMAVTVTYNDGGTRVLTGTSDYIVSPTNSALLQNPGQQEITVTYKGKSTSFNVTVNDKNVSSISIKSTPTSTTIIEGQKYDSTGLVVTVHYDNGTTKDISSGFTLSPDTSAPLMTVGTKTITVTYSEKTATFDITVKQKTLTGIKVTTSPIKMSYDLNEKFDKTGMVVTASFDNDTTEDITTSCTVSPDTSFTSLNEEQLITVSYGGMSDIFNVKVRDYTLADDWWTKTSLRKTAIFSLKIINSKPEGVISKSWDVDKNGTGCIKLDLLNDYNVVIYSDNGSKIKASTCNSMFSGFSQLVEMDIRNLVTANVTDMRSMFEGCGTELVPTLDISNLDTSSVTDMSCMFRECAFTNLDLRNFDTSNVSDMHFMFDFCDDLLSLDISSFNTSKVTNMNRMFGVCCNLLNLDVKNFDTSNVINMAEMFTGCEKLTSLDVSNFRTSSVTDMNYMFDDCRELLSLDVSNFDTSNVVNMAYMFSGCSGLTSLDVSNFKTTKVSKMEYMFGGCNKLSDLDLSKFDTSYVTNMGYMFRGCSALTSLDVSSFDTSKVTNMVHMFDECSQLVHLSVSNFDTSKVTDMSFMFSKCYSLTSLDLSNFNTSSVTNMHSMFDMGKFYKIVNPHNTNNYSSKGLTSHGSSLTSLDISKFDTSNVTNMNYMFAKCDSLTSLDLSHFNTSKVTCMENMFAECGGLERIDISNFATGRVTQLNGMFSGCSELITIYGPSEWKCGGYLFNGCTKLVGGKGTVYNSAHVDASYARIDGGTSAPGYFTSVNDRAASSISVKKAPNNTTIIEGQKYDSTGLVITVCYDDGSTKDITTGFALSPDTSIPLTTVGTQLITVTYSGKTTAFDITIKQKTLTGIKVTTSPTKMFYLLNDKFDKTGMVVTACYDNDTNEDITAICSIAPDTSFTSLSEEQRITVSYSGMSDTFNVKVRDYEDYTLADEWCKINKESITSLKFLDSKPESTIIKSWDVDKNGKGCIKFALLNTTDVVVYSDNGSKIKIKKCKELFKGFSQLTNIDLSNLDVGDFNTSDTSDMSSMFYDCSNLTSLDVSNFNTSNVSDMSYMFRGCSNLTSLDLSNFDTSNVINMESMFDGCLRLTDLNVSTFNTSNVRNMAGMFRRNGMRSDKPHTLHLSNFDTSNVTDMNQMFRLCDKLTELNISNFNTSNVRDMAGMFEECKKLQCLDLYNFDMSKVVNIWNMFYKCSELKTIYLSSDLSSIDGNYVFADCNKLVGGKGTAYDSAHIDASYARVDGGASAPGYFTKKPAP